MGIKFIDPNHTIKVISTQDSAIDKANSDMEKYTEDYDIKHLKFVEGEKPVYFVLSNVSSPDLVAIQQEHYITEMPKMTPGQTFEELKKQKVKVTPVRTGEMLIKYFKASCKKVILEDGTQVDVTDEFIGTVPPMMLQELGSFVMQRSLLNDSKKK